MMPTELPQPLLLILPFIAAPLSGWLSHDSLPEEANDAIALVVVLALAVVADIMTAPISGDVTLNFAMIFVYCVLLMNQPLLSSMQRWFTLHVGSPFIAHHRVVASEPAITASPPPMTPYPTPTGLDLRSSAVPPSRRPQFVDPSPALHSRPIVDIDHSKPIVVISVPSQNTQPMEATTPVPAPEPVEESPTKPEQA